MKLFPSDFFTPKDPARFQPVAGPVADLLPLLPKKQVNEMRAMPPAKVGRPRKSPHSYRREDFERQMVMAEILGAKFNNINSFAECVEKYAGISGYAKHLYAYLDTDRGLSKERIGFTNEVLRSVDDYFKDYDVSAIPLTRNWAKEYEENDLRVHRRGFVSIAINVASAVIKLQSSKPESLKTTHVNSPFPAYRDGWDDLEIDDPGLLQLLKSYGPALAEGIPRGSVESWVWMLAYHKLVKKENGDPSYSREMMDAHDSILEYLRESIADGVPITRLQVVLSSPAIID